MVPTELTSLQYCRPAQPEHNAHVVWCWWWCHHHSDGGGVISANKVLLNKFSATIATSCSLHTLHIWTEACDNNISHWPSDGIMMTIISCDGSHRTECSPAQPEHNTHVVLVVMVVVVPEIGFLPTKLCDTDSLPPLPPAVACTLYTFGQTTTYLTGHA